MFLLLCFELFRLFSQQRQKTSPKVVAQRTGAAKFEEYYDDDNNSQESKLKKRFSQDPDIEPVENDPEIYQGVLGRPGVDFPVMKAIPRTNFDCRNLGNGYFADLETSCQVSLTLHRRINLKKHCFCYFRFSTFAMKGAKSHSFVRMEQFSVKSI